MAVKKANIMLGMIKIYIRFKSKDTIQYNNTIQM